MLVQSSFKLQQRRLWRKCCAIISKMREMKLRPAIVGSQENQIGQKSSDGKEGRVDRHDVGLNALFLNMSREKWFNEPITTTASAQRRFSSVSRNWYRQQTAERDFARCLERNRTKMMRLHEPRIGEEFVEIKSRGNEILSDSFLEPKTSGK